MVAFDSFVLTWSDQLEFFFKSRKHDQYSSGSEFNSSIGTYIDNYKVFEILQLQSMKIS